MAEPRIAIKNGTRGHLVIEGVHDGEAGFQRVGGVLVAAFRVSGRVPRAGSSALVDGEPCRVVRTETGAVENFYRVYLEKDDG